MASTAPGARARTCGTRCNECSSASLDSSGGSGGRKARFRSVREGEEGRRSDRGESAFGYRRGKEKSLGEGKASIAGFCESAFTRGAGAHLDVGGGLLLDLGNGLFDLNLKIGRGTGRLGRPSRASFLLVPACTANETGKNEIDTWRRRHRTAERTSWTGSASASSHREVVAPMVKRTCACSLESDARGAAGGPVARALNGLNLNRGSALERKSRIANPQNASVRDRKIKRVLGTLGFVDLGPRAKGICVAREHRQSLIHARGHARALGPDDVRVSRAGTDRPQRPRSDCRRDSLRVPSASDSQLSVGAHSSTKFFTARAARREKEATMIKAFIVVNNHGTSPCLYDARIFHLSTPRPRR